MEFKDLRGKLVGVLGFGLEGKAALSFLLEHGVAPVLFDHRPWKDFSEEEQEAVKKLNVHFIFGPQCLKELKGFDIAFRSPGIPRLHEDIMAWEKTLTTGQFGLTSQTKWFFDHCPAKIVGVTGTKGKGTTATLIYNILQKQSENLSLNSRIFLTGNIGLVQPFALLPQLKAEDIVVFELSSFQLQDLGKSPQVGVCLMVTAEHLDHHAEIAEYHSAKEAITKFQTQKDFAVFNADYGASLVIGQLGSGQKIPISTEQRLDSGCFVDGDQLVVKNVAGISYEFPISNVQLRGRHNLQNIAAAAAAAVALDIDNITIQKCIEAFSGLEHRLEFVAEKQGVKYYNDSFSTTPETAIAAIQAFTEPEIVILGGSSKNSNFDRLGQTLADQKNVKALLLIGLEASRIQESFLAAGGSQNKVHNGGGSMDEIFAAIKKLGRPGDVVLLSPACASFGMFKNYKHRGQLFKEYVLALPA